MTIAATYPAAVISMALLRIFRGSILEENMARTVGSIGESVAAGAIFTIPAFIISGVWDNLGQRYLEATFIMMIGGIIGVLFVTLLRRVMVEDVDLPYPESVAAGEIHKAGRSGGTGAVYLFLAAIVGALIQALKQLSVFAASWEKFMPSHKGGVLLGKGGTTIPGSDGVVLSTPGVSPAYMGVGYIIGPRLASLNFAGGLLAWGLFVPLLLFFLGPSFEVTITPENSEHQWLAQATSVWKFIVRPIAIGGMLMSAAPDFGLMYDLTHMPLLYETPETSLSVLKDSLVHIHVGNAVLNPQTPGYGDQHARFGWPGSSNDVPEVTGFIRGLFKSGYMTESSPTRPWIGFEVKPQSAEGPSSLVIASAKRVWQEGWSRA